MTKSLPIALLVATLSGSLASAPALAQSPADRATARQLASDAQDAFDRKDYAAAADGFTRADAIYHAPTLVLGVARAELAQRHFVAAQEAYRRILREGVPADAPPLFKKALEDAKREIAGIEGHIAWVTVTVSGPASPSVKIDGAQLPSAALGVKSAVDPGEHTVTAAGDGFQTKEAKFTAAEGGTASVSLTLDNAAAAPIAVAPPPAGQLPPTEAPKANPKHGSMRRTLGFAGLGIGVVGVGLGAVTGILALGKHKTLADECTNGCPSDSQSDLSSYHTVGALSTIGFIAGGVGLVAGTVLLATAPKEGPSPTKTAHITIVPRLGVGSIGASGSF